LISRGSNSPLRSRGVSSSISPKSPFNVLAVTPVSRVAAVLPGGIVFRIAKMFRHLARQRSFHYSLCNLLQQRLYVFRRMAISKPFINLLLVKRPFPTYYRSPTLISSVTVHLNIA
jgi:hypothetical protein